MPESNEAVKRPKHYVLGSDACNIEAKVLIKAGLEAFVAANPHATAWDIYCFGNVLKYRLRVGKKDSIQQDTMKALEYEEFMDESLEIYTKPRAATNAPIRPSEG